jgi:hypothetical protein
VPCERRGREPEFMRPIFLSLLLTVSAGWCFPTLADNNAGATVVRAHSTCSYKYYPADSTPPPEVLPGMKGNTRYNFPFGANYNFSEDHSKLDKGCAVTLTVNSLEIHLGLTLDITLPKDCNEHLRSHEEGHRHLYEYFYDKYSEAAARKAGDEVFGKPVRAEGKNCKEAKDAAIALLNDKLGAVYRKFASDPAKNANDDYDKMTNHGRFEKVDSMTAADQVIKDYTDGKGIEQASTETPAASPTGTAAPAEPPTPNASPGR